MVVVLVVIARTATPARAAVAVFRANGRAANMVLIVADTRETAEIVLLGRRVLARLGGLLSRLVRCFTGAQQACLFFLQLEPACYSCHAAKGEYGGEDPKYRWEGLIPGQ